MLRIVGVLGALLVVGCSSANTRATSDTALSPSTAVVSAGSDPCRAVASVGSQSKTETQADVEVIDRVLVTATLARYREDLCGPPSSLEALCRALWLAQHLDPLHVWTLGGHDRRREAAEILHWAFRQPTETTTGPLGAAVVQLASINAELTDLLAEPPGDDVARLVLARADPQLLEPLREAEAVCA